MSAATTTATATAKTMAVEENDGESARWLHFLSRWALAMVLMGVALLVAFFVGIGFSPSDNALGTAYSELLQAVRAPVPYKIFAALDGLGWLAMAGGLLTLAAILRRQAPIRALIIAGCGIAMATGSLGSVMRLFGVSDLAAHYAIATTAQQATLLPTMLALYENINVYYILGDLLGGAGWLLVASIAFSLASFPRWLAGWFVLAGGLSLLEGITNALGAFSFAVLMLTVVVGVMGLHAGIAVAFWRPSPAQVSSLASTA